MANDPNNIRLGPCRVRWGGIDLGMTKGGVEVEVSTSTKEVTVDQFGETPVNEYVTGRKLTIKCPFAETDLDTLYNLMRYTGASLVQGSGVRATGTITNSSAVPANNDTVTVNGVVFTFKTTLTGAANEVLIGATITETMATFTALLNASANPSVNVASYSANVGVITVTYKVPGTAGNAFTLAKSGTNLAVSGATLTTGAAGSGRRVEVTSGVGLSLYTTAQELILHPTEKVDSDRSEDFVVPKAATAGGLSFAYQNDTERLFNLTFTGYPNTSTGLLFIYGDKGSA